MSVIESYKQKHNLTDWSDKDIAEHIYQNNPMAQKSFQSSDQVLQWDKPEPKEQPGQEEQQGYLETAGKGLTRGVEQLAAGVGSATRWLGEEMKYKPMAEVGDVASDYWREAAREGWEKRDPEIYKGSFWENPSLKRATGIISEALPSLGAAITTSVATGSPATGGLMLGGLEGAPQYEEARKSGMNVSDASTQVGVPSTVGTAALEYLPISRMIGRSGGTVRRMMQGGSEEALQESTQTLWQNIIAKLGYDKTRNLAEGMTEAAIGGAGAGSIMSAATGQDKADTPVPEELTEEEVEAAEDSIKKQLVDFANDIENQRITRVPTPKVVQNIIENQQAAQQTREKVTGEPHPMADQVQPDTFMDQMQQAMEQAPRSTGQKGPVVARSSEMEKKIQDEINKRNNLRKLQQAKEKQKEKTTNEAKKKQLDTEIKQTQEKIEQVDQFLDNFTEQVRQGPAGQPETTQAQTTSQEQEQDQQAEISLNADLGTIESTWSQAADKIDQLERQNNEKIQTLQQEKEQLKGKKDKQSNQRRKEINQQIKDLKDESEQFRGILEEQFINQMTELKEQIQKEAERQGVQDEDTLDSITEDVMQFVEEDRAKERLGPKWGDYTVQDLVNEEIQRQGQAGKEATETETYQQANQKRIDRAKEADTEQELDKILQEEYQVEERNFERTSSLEQAVERRREELREQQTEQEKRDKEEYGEWVFDRKADSTGQKGANQEAQKLTEQSDQYEYTAMPRQTDMGSEMGIFRRKKSKQTDAEPKIGTKKKTRKVQVGDDYDPDVQKVEGKDVTIPGFEDFDFFVHKTVGKGKDWVVTESQTGKEIGRGSNQKEAVQKAQQDLSNAFTSQQGLQEQIDKIKKDGLTIANIEQKQTKQEPAIEDQTQTVKNVEYVDTEGTHQQGDFTGEKVTLPDAPENLDFVVHKDPQERDKYTVTNVEYGVDLTMPGSTKQEAVNNANEWASNLQEQGTDIKQHLKNKKQEFEQKRKPKSETANLQDLTPDDLKYMEKSELQKVAQRLGVKGRNQIRDWSDLFDKTTDALAKQQGTPVVGQLESPGVAARKLQEGDKIAYTDRTTGERREGTVRKLGDEPEGQVRVEDPNTTGDYELISARELVPLEKRQEQEEITPEKLRNALPQQARNKDVNKLSGKDIQYAADAFNITPDQVRSYLSQEQEQETKEVKQKEKKTWQEPNTVFREVRDFNGNFLGFVFEEYDGTREGAREAAPKLESKADKAFGDQWSNIQSRIGATDENGNAKFTISPNYKNVRHVSEEEEGARYTWGEIPEQPTEKDVTPSTTFNQGDRVEITQEGTPFTNRHGEVTETKDLGFQEAATGEQTKRMQLVTVKTDNGASVQLPAEELQTETQAPDNIVPDVEYSNDYLTPEQLIGRINTTVKQAQMKRQNAERRRKEPYRQEDLAAARGAENRAGKMLEALHDWQRNNPQAAQNYDIPESLDAITAHTPKTEAAPAQYDVPVSYAETHHAKRDIPLYVVKLDQRVDKQTFNKLKTEATKQGGWYSSYKKQGAVPGFQFTDKANAQKFANNFKSPPAELATEEDQAQVPAGETETAPETQGTTLEESGYGDNNTVVTKERYRELHKRLNDKINRLHTGLDPELLAIGTEIAAYHIEAGARKFNDYAQRMIQDFGENIKPYLKGFYKGAREMPGMENFKQETDSDQDVDAIDVNNIGVKGAAQEQVAQEKIEAGDYVQAVTDTDYLGTEPLKVTWSDGERIRLKGKGRGSFNVEKFQKVTAPEQTQATGDGTQQIQQWVKGQLENGNSFNWNKLVEVANDAFGGTQANNIWSPRDAYNALELGINQYIKDNPALFDPQGNFQDVIERIRTILNRIPTQTKRTADMEEYQQFSTPPHIAYAANWVADIQANDTMLEPSAGMGGLAVFAENSGAKVILNEYDKARAQDLKEQGYEVYNENAEQLNNTLSSHIKPTTVIMNPPFSATAGRKAGSRDTKNAQKHIEQALKRLQPNGRLVAITGKGMANDKASMQDWWNKIKKEYNVKANVRIEGKEYQKFGTTFDIQMIVIDKSGPTPLEDGILTTEVSNVDQLAPLLKEVKDARPITGPIFEETGQEQQEGTTKPGTSGSTTTTTRGATGDTGRSTLPEGDVGRGDGTDVQRTERDEDRRMDETGQPDSPGTYHGVRDVTGSEGQDTRARTPDSVSHEQDLSSGEITTTEQESREELSDSVYEPYKPYTTIEGAQEHPTELDESAAMAAVQPPRVGYVPQIPKKVINEGRLSDAQLEVVINAGAKHEMTLPDNKRQGFFVGDGTGVGKGREVAAIMWDNWNQGRKKAVWISENQNLLNDAKRDITSIGWNPDVIFPINKTAIGSNIKAKEGIIFLPYGTLASSGGTKFQQQQRDLPQEQRTDKPRLQQIINWVGEDFDGVIAFDEAHKMGNAITMGTGRQRKQPSNQALAALELQDRLPNARVVYFSATGATEVKNLAYLKRLGLWGSETPFASVRDFIDEIESGGVAAMEMVASDMKAMGKYLARSLSYKNVTYSQVTHELTKEQRDAYNKFSEAWQTIFKNIEAAMADDETGQAGDGNKKARIMSHFWGLQQRFYNQLLTTMQLPTVLSDIQNQLDNGNSAVVQLVNTMEAQTERAMQDLTEDQSLEEMDLTPRKTLIEFVNNAFPIQQFEEYVDDNSNLQWRPVTDSEGNPVYNQEAIARRDALVADLARMDDLIPQGPLDEIIEHFGRENVAEVTGRTRRPVWVQDQQGNWVKDIETRSKAAANKDVDDFMDGEKRILVFSQAGGTGRSYHADLGVKNQQKRIHYILQPGWRADQAIQGMGRTHRSNQAVAPHFNLVTTDVPSQKRFISTIARRLDQLGALTKGERETGSQGIFQAEDNLESHAARAALRDFFHNLYQGNIPNLSVEEFESQTDLDITDHDNNLLQQLPEMKQFLNRSLSLTLDTQQTVFDNFYSLLRARAEQMSEQGVLDQRMKTIQGENTQITDEQTIYVHPETGAETKYYQLQVTNPRNKRTFEDVDALTAHTINNAKFFRNRQSGAIWAYTGRTNSMMNQDTGTLESRHKLFSVVGNQMVADYRLRDTERWEPLNKTDAKKLWDEKYKNTPDTYTDTYHLISGTMLPIWDRIKGDPQLVRTLTNEGRTILGRQVPNHQINETLTNFNAETEGASQIDPDTAINSLLETNQPLRLSNGWRVKKSRVSGEDRIEITGRGVAKFKDELEDLGAFEEIINHKSRFFIPSNRARSVLKDLNKSRPIVEIGAAPEGPQYSRASREVRKNIGLQKSTIDQHINKILQNWTNVPPVNVLQSQEELPQKVQDDIEYYNKKAELEQVEGVWHQGQVFLIADNINSTDRLETALIHEVIGHFGVESVLGKDRSDNFFMQIYLSKKNRVDKLARNYGLDLRHREDKIAAAKELVARMTERGETNNILDRMVQAVKNALRKMGFKVQLGNTEIRDLISRASSFVEQGQEPGQRTSLFDSPALRKQAQPWYSQMQNVLSDKLPNKGDPGQMKQQIQSWAKKGLFKQEELEWSGVETWLDEQEGKVNKEDVLDFIQANQIQVEEVKRKELEPEDIPSNQQIDALAEWLENNTEEFEGNTRNYIREKVIGSGGEIGRLRGTFGAPKELLEPFESTIKEETLYDEHTIEGGNKYQEWLLTLPKVTMSDLLRRQGYEPNTMTVKERNEAIKQMPSSLKNRWTREDYMSPHWGDTENILSHVRFETHMSFQGENVLFIEEVQSDWHQTGKKEGYAKNIPRDREGFLQYMQEHYPNGAYTDAVRQERGFEPLTDEEITEIRESENEPSGGVPDAPFKTTWPLLSIKRMIREAAERGHDKLAWTPGKLQAKRYNLNKIIDTLEHDKLGSTNNPTYIELRGWRDGERIFREKRVEPNKLNEYVGKDLANKILNSDKKTAKWTNIDLEVGGEGMKKFYDQILPSQLNKYLKKWGVKTKHTSILISNPYGIDKQLASEYIQNEDRKVYGFNAETQQFEQITSEKQLNDKKYSNFIKTEDDFVELPAWEIPITKEMRDSVLDEGQPLFRRQEPEAQFSRNPLQQESYQEQENRFKQAINQFVDENGNLSPQKFFKKTDIQLPTNDKKDLIKGFRWIQTMQDLAKNFKPMNDLFETENERVSNTNQMSVADRAESEAYFTLPQKSLKRLRKPLKDGDLQHKEWDEETLRNDYGLNENEIAGYKAVRNLLNKKLDQLAAKMLSDIMDVNDPNIETQKLLDTLKMQKGEHLRKSLRGKFQVDDKQVEKLSWIADWIKDHKGYVPHKWQEPWRVWVKTLNKKGKEQTWMLDVPSHKGKVAPTRELRRKGANQDAVQVLKNKFNWNENTIKKKMDQGEVKLIHHRDTPLELFEGSRMDVVKSIVDSAVDKQWESYRQQLTDKQLQDVEELKGGIKEQVEELYLGKGWGQHLIGRKGTLGYREDFEEVIPEYLYGYNSFVNKGEAAQKFANVMKQIDPTKTPVMWKHGKEFISDMLGESYEAGWFKTFASTYYLAGDVSAAALNMTQNWTHAVGILRPIKPKDKTTAEQELFNAMKDIGKEYTAAKKEKRRLFSKASVLSQEDIDAMQEAYDRGVLDPSYFGELTGMHPTRIHQHYTKEAFRAIFKLFSGSEAWNRTSSFLAAYRRAKRAGYTDPVRAGVDVSRTAHFVYGRGNRPNVIRKTGAAGNIAYTFMTYPINNLVFLKHRAEDLINARTTEEKRDAMKVIGSNLGYLFAFGGLAGLPFSHAAQWIYDLFTDPEDDWEKLIRKHTPKTIGRTITRGFPAGFLGNDMSWRVQGTDVLGMPIGFQVIKQMKRKAIESQKVWGQGQELKAIFQLAPDMVANPYEAIMGYREGGQRRGAAPIQYDLGEAVNKAMGFTPTREAETYKTVQIAKEKRKNKLETLGNFAEKWIQAYKNQDYKAFQELRKEVRNYNRAEMKEGRERMLIPWGDVKKNAKQRMEGRQKGYAEGQLPEYAEKFYREQQEAFGLNNE